MGSIVRYVKDSYYELTHNVTWTPFDELQNSTTIVIVSLILITVMVWVMDKISELAIVTGIYGNI